MNEDIILKLANRVVVNGKMSYEKFDEVYDFITKKEQYEVIDVLFKNGIELVDEVDIADENDLELISLNNEMLYDDVFKDDIEDDDEYILVKDEIKQSNTILCVLIQQGNKQAAQDLCVKNKKLVCKIAGKYYKMYNSSLDMDDLEQAGYLGMLKAAQKFDISQGFAFSTYATWWIKQSIAREILDNGNTIRIPVHMMENINKVLREERNHLDLDLSERISAIAYELEMDEETVKRCFELRNLTNINSLDRPVGEDESTELIELISSEEDESLESIIIKKDLKAELENIFLSLKERERDVIKMRFGWNDDIERTLEDVGKEYGVTRERIRQIEAKVIKTLRYIAERRKMKDYLYR